MKHIIAGIIAFSFLGLGIAAADTVTPDAVVLQITGSVMVQLPGQTTPVALAEGARIPQGATIITGAGSEVSIRPIGGVVSTIKANTTVQIEKLSVTTDNGAVSNQTAMISLLSGNLVSTLDPSKKHINNYGVRTPKGVAAARGTIYAVGVDAGGGSTFATLSGTVSITLGNGSIVKVDLGTGLVISDTSGSTPASTPLSQASPEVKAAVLEAANTVINLVKNNLEPTGDAAATTTLLAAVVKAANEADPVAGKAITASAIDAAKTNTTTSGSAASIANDLNAAGGQGSSTGGSTTPVTTIDTSIVSPSH
jgi:hypothetical protein